ncbi:MAG: protein translocase subunit SecF [Gammaproteobacteria bacterium]|nr:protein translocase subunit SecF [Gammaproteobacteria bacterium]MBT5406101.1 protein translocase subunit SecF [Gammaproteobacteria bacterium]MBT5644460.1 protein translocase subunit SecF [Gammaproteobacteria bacterium]MBT7236054.1 protein translocase subunit SecF [Gammaproteobacteria bacterium]
MFKLISSSSNYNFLGQKKIAIVISAFLVIISLTSFITKGLNWGIDFSSGYIIQLKFDKEVNISEIRTAFEDNGVTDSVMQSFGSNNEIIIKLKEESNFNKDSVNIFLLDTLSETHPFKILKLEFVGAQIGDELREKGEWAMLVALLSILVYIGFRFELLFGVGAIIALIHDVVITLGFFSLLQIEFNLSVLSAILAVIGYSLNDTIVVYDRIRENINIIKTNSYVDILNISINQTLSRTLITSLTTMFVLLSLFILGGSAVEYFALAMMIGILIGTYSSIFVASTSLYFLGANAEQRNDL